MHRKSFLLGFASALMLLVVAACATRTIYIRPQDPVQLRENVRGVKVWTFDKDGVRVPSELDLQEGWFVMSDEE